MQDGRRRLKKAYDSSCNLAGMNPIVVGFKIGPKNRLGSDLQECKMSAVGFKGVNVHLAILQV